MATQASLDMVQKAYVAYYGRPADPLGQAYWADRLDAVNGNLDEIINAFGTSDEASAIYGSLDYAAAVNALYMQQFGREPELDGLKYYVAGLQAGTFTLASLALNIANGAQGSDLVALNSKISAADAFTAAIDTTAEVLAYSGDEAAAAARAELSSVVDAETLAVFDADAAVVAVSDAQAGATGETFTLTANQDTGASFTGTSGNDTFNGNDATLTTGDNLKGGAGTDTLNLVISDDSITPVVDLDSIEKVSIRNADATVPAGLALDAGTWTGVEIVENLRSATGADIALTNVQNNVTVALNKSSSNVAVTFASNALASTTATLAVTADTIGASTVTATVAGTDVITKLNVTSTGDNSAGLTFGNLSGSDEITEITVSGAGDIEVIVDADDDANIATLAAASMTGGLTIDLSGSGKNVTANTGSGDDDLTFGNGNDTINAGDGDNIIVTGGGNNTVTTGAGADTVTVGNGTDTVNTGAGNDRIILAGNLDTTDRINGGDGTDTIVVSDATLNGTDKTLFAATLTSIEEVATTATTGVTIDFNALSIIDRVRVEGVDGGVAQGSAGSGVGAASVIVTIENADTLTIIADRTGQMGADGGSGADGANGGAGLSLAPKLEGGSNAATLILVDDADLTGGKGGALNGSAANDGSGGAAINASQIETLNIVLHGSDTTADAVALTGGAAGGSGSGTAAAGVGVIIESNGTINITDALIGTGTKYSDINLGTVTGNNVTINAGTLHGKVTVTAGDGNVNITTGAGADVVTGGAGIDTFSTGAGNDQLDGLGGADFYTGGAGRDVFTISAEGGASYDSVSDFGKVTTATTSTETDAMNAVSDFIATATGKGGADADLLVLAGANTTAIASVQTNLNVANAEAGGGGGMTITATSTAKGFITLAGADAAEINTLAEWVAVAALVAETNGEAAVFVYDGSTYVYQQDTTDVLVQLTGVTGTTGLVLSGAATAAAVGDIFIL
ncbi:DUF4214 domain-containing protein [Thauera aromatica]|uniref:DUF4214 domain-containing protein n=1 Tax=Thauera aromatica TaxID=59405 RepID=UPI001FFC9791|nr:DUF4214 domain-containing protein [Thauera aromatica]MCK2097395.1 DUF4214 domain-containing protein [Thauera aromatica]